MDDKVQALATLFRNAKSAHLEAFLDVDGADPEWPIWYADYLADTMPALLETEMTKSELVYWLVHLAKTQPTAAPDSPWEEYYAGALVAHYA